MYIICGCMHVHQYIDYNVITVVNFSFNFLFYLFFPFDLLAWGLGGIVL